MGGALPFKKEGRQSCDSFIYLLFLFLMGNILKMCVCINRNNPTDIKQLMAQRWEMAKFICCFVYLLLLFLMGNILKMCVCINRNSPTDIKQLMAQRWEMAKEAKSE